ncbi:hypothetical protein FB004_106359 [Sinorhizobium medicae]|nr:hypothetical protein FB004_106359 [Sinorhizobium medicae]TWA24846.1 hypothetical protein FB007_13815 [Sinorhizobium medicae]TWA31650.1 hypothetical protein FB009_13215 [Sinorhizobium medicae]
MAAAVIVDGVDDGGAAGVETGFADQQCRPEIAQIVTLHHVLGKHHCRDRGSGHARPVSVLVEQFEQRTAPIDVVKAVRNNAARDVVDTIEDRLFLVQPQPFQSDHAFAACEPQLPARDGIGQFLGNGKHLVNRRIAVVARHIGDALEDGYRPVHMDGGNRGNEPATAVLDIDGAILLQKLQCFPERGTGNLEAIRQLRLCRQLVSGNEPLIPDQIGDAVAELDHQGTRVAKGLGQFLSPNKAIVLLLV